MATTKSPDVIRFGSFEVDCRSGELFKRGHKLKLPHQSFQILAMLLERPGELVTREEIQKRLWPSDTVVEFEHSINAAIRRLRLALGDTAGKPHFVETLAKRGYRFIGIVSQPAVDASQEKTPEPDISMLTERRRAAKARRLADRLRPSVVAGAALVLTLAATGVYWLARSETRGDKPIRSLAILPFTNASSDPNAEYLSDGITEHLINRLSRLEQLRLAARSLAFRYKGKQISPQTAGRELEVEAVVTGRVLLSGQSINIQVELMQVDDGSQLWGEQFDRELSDLMQAQEDITGEIAKRLKLDLTPEEQKVVAKRYTQNSEAHQLYTKGAYFWNKRTEQAVQTAIAYFQQALEADPNYAQAYALLSDCYAILAAHEIEPAKQLFSQARMAADNALRIDDTLAEAHAALAQTKFFDEWDWEGTEQEMRRAIELNPNYPTAHQRYSLFLMAIGRNEESLAEINRALKLDPVSISINSSLGWRLYCVRRYDEALAQFRATLEMDPNFAGAHYSMGRAHVKKGQYQEALAAFRRAHAVSTLNSMAFEGHTLALSGQKEKALKILTKLKALSKVRYVSPYNLALIYAGLGDRDESLNLLQKAYDDRVPRVVYLGAEPLFDSLRPDPRFQALLTQIGLPKAVLGSVEGTSR
jgi:TolB-like protein/DNA-binding winged helix-turn-helix (wHTH) protein/Flp pilus assembly protein TadD